MKKFIVSILSVLYLATSSGAAINFHYCMGKFTGWDLSLPASNKCSNCGMKKENQTGCCHDEHKILETKKDQLAAQINVVPDNNFKYLPAEYLAFTKNYLSVHADKIHTAHSPPGINTIPFILNCVFRI
ncbi:MAG: hypothetical protein JO072_00895 [Parafilimonas sp.]|nr:hypothetical protein [Parafilimonas sp.]